MSDKIEWETITTNHSYQTKIDLFEIVIWLDTWKGECWIRWRLEGGPEYQQWHDCVGTSDIHLAKKQGIFVFQRWFETWSDNIKSILLERAT